MIKTLTRTLAATAVALAAAGTAMAQDDYPSRPIRFVVSFAGLTEGVARAIAEQVTAATRQPVVVDVRPGASGIVAAEAVAKAAPDGYTVLITTNTTHAANEHLYKKLSYDPVKDFAPLGGLGKGGQVLVVPANASYKNVGELVAFAKANPGKLSFGSGSSSSRVAGELFQQLAGVNILHVPYRSNPMGITDLLGGQITMMFTDASTGMPQITTGKVRALGVTSARRMASLPDVPTISEAGVKGYDSTREALQRWRDGSAPSALTHSFRLDAGRLDHAPPQLGLAGLELHQLGR